MNKTKDENSQLLRGVLAEFNDFQGSGDYPTILACLFSMLPRLEAIQIE